MFAPFIVSAILGSVVILVARSHHRGYHESLYAPALAADPEPEEALATVRCSTYSGPEVTGWFGRVDFTEVDPVTGLIHVLGTWEDNSRIAPLEPGDREEPWAVWRREVITRNWEMNGHIPGERPVVEISVTLPAAATWKAARACYAV